jgi:hypothetical protein
MSRTPKPFSGDMYFNGMYTVVRKAWLREILRDASGETQADAEEAMSFASGKGATVSLDRVLDYICNRMSLRDRKDVRTALFGDDEDMPRLAANTTNGFAAGIAQRRLTGQLKGPEEGPLGSDVSNKLSSGRTVIQVDEEKVYVSTRRKR